MKKSLQFFIVFFSGFAVAQAPAIQWQKTLGGTSTEVAESIQQTIDGGYIVTGYTGSNNGDVSGNHSTQDAWVVKLDNTGSLSWQKALGGTAVEDSTSIQQTIDGGYILAGFTFSNDGDVSGNHGTQDAWIVKLDNLGAISWQKTLGGTAYDRASSVQQTTDGGYIVAGYTSSNDGDVSGNHGGGDVWVVKLTNLGAVSWQKTLGGTSEDAARSIKQTDDGGYIVAGYTGSNNGDVSGNHGYNDFWILKLDSVGTVSWQKALGGTNPDEAKSIEQTRDGGYIVAGYTNSVNGDVLGNHGLRDVWIVKLDILGGISWQKALGGTGSEEAFSIKGTTNDGFIVSGDTLSNDGDVSGNHGGGDVWIVKLDSDGAVSWQKTLGGTSSENGYGIQQTIDGGYVVAGGAGSNNGDVLGNHGSADFWVVKLGADLGTESFSTKTAFKVYPNPATSVINIQGTNNPVIDSVVIANVLGKKVFETYKNITAINVENLHSGVYFIQITSEEKTACVKFVKE